MSQSEKQSRIITGAGIYYFRINLLLSEGWRVIVWIACQIIMMFLKQTEKRFGIKLSLCARKY